MEIEDSFDSEEDDVKKMFIRMGTEKIGDNNVSRSSVTVVTLNTINTIVGGGILTLPYTVSQSGLVLGFISIFVSLWFGIFSIKLLILWKQATGFYWYGSIGYEWYGRKSIFLVNSLVSVLCLGLPASFMIIFADATTPLIQELLNTPSPTIRSYVIIIIGLMLLWFCLNKEVHKLRVASYTSIICVTMFFLVLLFILFNHSHNLEYSLSSFLAPKSFRYYFTTIPNIFVSFWFQPWFFALYTSLQARTPKNALKFTTGAYAFAIVVYLMISVLALLIFGNEVKSDILINISQSKYEFKHCLLVVYLVISAMHMPMVFFAGKEAVINLYLELKSNEVSKNWEVVRDKDHLRN